jgi:hypothetical protein
MPVKSTEKGGDWEYRKVEVGKRKVEKEEMRYTGDGENRKVELGLRQARRVECGRGKKG